MSLPIVHGVLIAAHQATKIAPDAVLSKDRHARVTDVRHAVQYVLRQRTDWSTLRLGKIFGRDHSTIIHGVQQTKKRIEADPDIATLVEKLMAAPALNFVQYDHYVAQITDPLKVLPAPKPLRLKPVARGVPAPVRPIDDELTKNKLRWFASIDDEGHCYGERHMVFDLRRGSEKLRRAIVLARAA